jgi:hypothetical protein
MRARVPDQRGQTFVEWLAAFLVIGVLAALRAAAASGDRGQHTARWALDRLGR